jgi:transcriptional regulator with XRE-family HTH domain
MAQMTATRLPTIGDVVLAWRKFRGLRSTELVQLAGIKKGYLSALEHNKRATPQETYLAKLADALEVPLQDIYGRRLPPKDGAAVTTTSSKQGVAGQGNQQISADEDEETEAEEEEEVYSIVNAALRIPDSLLGTLGDQIEEIMDFINSLSLTDQEEELVASHLDTAKQLLRYIAAQREIRKEG